MLTLGSQFHNGGASCSPPATRVLCAGPSGTCLPHTLWTNCSLLLELSSYEIFIASSIISFKSLLRCHLLTEVFSKTLCSIAPHSQHTHPSLSTSFLPFPTLFFFMYFLMHYVIFLQFFLLKILHT